MNDCCASSSSRDKLAASASATLPSYVVRPGVTFPDWSVVKSPAVKDALLAMVGSDHVFDRWSGYDPATDRVRCSSSTRNMAELRPQTRLRSAQG